MLPVSFTLDLFLTPEPLLKACQKITHLTHAMEVVRAADYIIRGPRKRSAKGLEKVNTTTNNLTRGVTLKQAAATSTSLAIHRNRRSVVGIACGYGLVGPGFDFSPKRPDRLWGPSNFLFMGYGDSFPGKAAGQ